MTDREIQEHVHNAIDFDPSIDGANVGVTVDNGIVTLRGDIKSYTEKLAAERLALQIYGVKAVANDLIVKLGPSHMRTDSDIAQAAVNALRWNVEVPSDSVIPSVSNGWIVLTGNVEWRYQREAAEQVVRNLTGLRGLTNEIVVKPHVATSDVRAKIQAAFRRSAEVDARRITVAATEGTVTLSGSVRSWAEREEARHAAWAAPGVHNVVDRMTVTP